MAEVLITLAIIGVVAALTIPPLIKNHNQKAWSTAQDVFTKRLEVATRQMNTEEKLAGYESTMDFVNELKKYIKITRVCDSNELTKCFAKTVTTANNLVYNTQTDLEQLTKEDWRTGTVGVQFANGVYALIAYNPDTTQDPYNNQFAASAESMAIIYDVSGYKNPNILGKDINVNGNVKPLGCIINADDVSGMCISQILAPGSFSPLTKTECEEIADQGYGNNKADCGYYDSDYWAGAVKACGGTQNMPTNAQLIALAEYIYPDADSISISGFTYSDWDADRASLFMAQSPYSDYFYVWSGVEQGQYSANICYFASTQTSIGGGNRANPNYHAVCLDQ